MRTYTECINDILELYEFHKKESDKYSTILGILRGTPDDNKIIISTKVRKKKAVEIQQEIRASRPIGQLRRCKNPKCKKTFRVSHKAQLYCCKLCSSRGSVALNYLRKKELKSSSVKQFPGHTNPPPPPPIKNTKELLNKIKKEIPIKEIERPTVYHEG